MINREPASHGYAMMAMGLARAYRLIGNYILEEKVSNAGCYDRYKISRKKRMRLC